MFLKALADDTRLAILCLLALTDLTAGEIDARLGAPQNAISYHLRLLRTAGLLRDRRSARDARDVYYSLDFSALERLYRAVGMALHPALLPAIDPAITNDRPVPAVGDTLMSTRVLFLCTGNSARSQMAEAILRREAGDRFEVHSAGSAPADFVHPMAVAVLAELGIILDGAHPKHLNLFLGQPWDWVITVCDRARDACPTFPGNAARIHWSFDDPAAAQGTDEERMCVFRRVRDEIRQRIRLFVQATAAASAGSR